MRTWTYPAQVVRVVDGDTVWLDLDMGLRIRMRSSCRLGGINAPELSEPGGPEARDWLIARLADRVIEAVSTGLDKYGRPVVTLRETGGASINEEMLSQGHATRYAG